MANSRSDDRYSSLTREASVIFIFRIFHQYNISEKSRDRSLFCKHQLAAIHFSKWNRSLRFVFSSCCPRETVRAISIKPTRGKCTFLRKFTRIVRAPSGALALRWSSSLRWTGFRGTSKSSSCTKECPLLTRGQQRMRNPFPKLSWRKLCRGRWRPGRKHSTRWFSKGSQDFFRPTRFELIWPGLMAFGTVLKKVSRFKGSNSIAQIQSPFQVGFQRHTEKIECVLQSFVVILSIYSEYQLVRDKTPWSHQSERFLL